MLFFQTYRGMFKVIKNKEQWNTILKMVDTYDMYHTYEYHQITKNEGEEPILISYSEKDKLIAIPLLLRNIPDSDYMDCTSVYGYAGPISKNIDESFNPTSFTSKFNKVLIDNNIVSIFSRLNPFIPNQEFCLNGLGEITPLSTVVNIDISQSEEEQVKEYHKRFRTQINKARRVCNLKYAETKEEVLQYIALYYENMKRVCAKKEYFFNEEYFFKLINATDFNTRILLALDKNSDKIIAGAMFIEKNKIIQYHLSGADANFLKHYAIKLLIDEMRRIATNENYKFFNLGGGIGNKKDSLFDFKAGFSKDYKQFTVWRYTVNDKAYGELALKNQEKKACTVFHKDCTLFFPCYRCNL